MSAVARPHVRRAARRARRQAPDARGLGRAAPRPRRSRLRRPARPQRRSPARDQPERAPEAAELAHGIRNEFVLQAEGEIVARAPETVNASMPTGEVELQVDTLEIVSTLPAAPVPARRGGRRRDAPPALPLARSAPRQAAAQHPPARTDGRDHPPAHGGGRASSTSRHRSCSSRHRRAPATSSCRAGCTRAASSRCRRARRS